jgi:uncharacterized protein
MAGIIISNMEISNFIIQNVWWKGKEYLEEDKHLREYREKKYKWQPKILKDIRLIPGNLYSLRGPRQIGKTTLVKLIIESLIQNGVQEKMVFYMNCDSILGSTELLNTLRDYHEYADSLLIKEKYVFLDEISGIENWQKTIKVLVDSGEMKNTCLFLTGSHTLDIKKGFDMLPGRTGKYGKDFLLLPLTFNEYVRLIKPEIGKKLEQMGSNSISLAEINSAVSSALPFDHDLKIIFNQYLLTGGFPLAINEFHTGKTIPDYVYEIYSRWVIGDIVKWGKQEKILKQILRTAILKQSTAVSFDSFAKEAEIKSHKTVSTYVEDLENMFVFLVLYFMDFNKKIPDYNRNKKIYFFDPFIYHIFNRLLNLKEAEINPSLIESVAVVHFARLVHGLYPKASFNDLTFYWKNKKETDIVLKLDTRLLAVEVKYQEKITKDDFQSLYHFESGLILSKSLLKLDDKYSVIPVHLMLAVI